ncbi:DUF2461 domain-containing protein [Nocardioides perillae]|uniref:Uncharacterized protein (TIGR02453 family) n=1 Tax=Nocardioides perillae TaxID=1119534 RepID=A0A7Y9RQJ8_9ACTN|nr:DUF2461 domain-containing protein [Nocardioides perillae]NYG54475.1 uncharacterized protein (TIGR02453 family) [Nocardioides perillae]
MAGAAGPAAGEAPAFTGFPVAALDFYDDLEVDNSRTFWEAHVETWRSCVKAPMDALTAALAPEFGAAKVFRPYRDVRFAKDKTPYKTHQGAFVATGPATGWYVEVSARGVRTGGGFYDAGRQRLAAFREAAAHDEHGPRLQAVLDALRADGWEVGGDRLKTSPRGWSADHPRIDLLRHRSLTVGRHHGFEPVIHTPGLLEVVRADWRALRPLLDWLDELPPDELER